MFPSERHVGSSTLECFLTPHLPLRFYDMGESSILAARKHSELLPYLGRKQRFSLCTYMPATLSVPNRAIGLVNC
jgi:hypothetical protein